MPKDPNLIMIKTDNDLFAYIKSMFNTQHLIDYKKITDWDYILIHYQGYVLDYHVRKIRNQGNYHHELWHRGDSVKSWYTYKDGQDDPHLLLNIFNAVHDIKDEEKRVNKKANNKTVRK